MTDIKSDQEKRRDEALKRADTFIEKTPVEDGVAVLRYDLALLLLDTYAEGFADASHGALAHSRDSVSERSKEPTDGD